MENAGAEYAVIINSDNNILNIVASGKHNEINIDLNHKEPIEESLAIPLNIIKYVTRTRKSIVLNNAIADKVYSDNSYIQKNYVRSVFCHPILHKNKLFAILYLENNLSSNVFTTSHIETVNLLSAQLAISMDNAMLYEHLEEKVVERTSQLRKAKEEIEKTHSQITDSINYASRIQKAILPTNKLFKNHFSDFFILFKPRDVVSGDFYWAKKINDNIIFAAADCTGHGVPSIC